MTRPLFRFIAAATVAATSPHRCRRAARAVRSRQPGNAPQAESGRLADVQPHLRRAAVQPAEADHPANVGQLKEAFKKELGNGPHESIPIVYRGVHVHAAAGRGDPGDQRRDRRARSGNTGGRAAARAPRPSPIYEDMVYYTSPDGFIVALDARTGEVRWETKTPGGMVAGVIVVEGKVDTGRACGNNARRLLRGGARREDRRGSCGGSTRRAGSNEPGGETWARRSRCDPRRRPRGDCPAATTRCSGSSIGASPIPTPNTRANRHGGNARRGSASRRRSISTATRPSRSIRTPASWPGTTSTCPATTGTRTTRTSGRCCAPPVSPDPEVRQVDQSGRQAGRAARHRDDGGRGRRHLGARPRHRAVPVGHAVPVRHAQLPDLEHRRQDRPRDDQQERDVHRPAGPQGDLLLEHAQLLADGLSPRHQLAVRARTSRTAST